MSVANPQFPTHYPYHVDIRHITFVGTDLMGSWLWEFRVPCSIVLRLEVSR